MPIANSMCPRCRLAQFLIHAYAKVNYEGGGLTNSGALLSMLLVGSSA
jgi:hypothetical protein